MTEEFKNIKETAVQKTENFISTQTESKEIQEMKFRLATANHFFKAGCFSGDVKNAEQAYVKIQAGAEMGMKPMEAMNSLYIVNGHVSIWGMALSKRLKSKGWIIQYEDTDDSCTVTIAKGDETYSYTTTKREMEKMNSRAFKFAPKEKMRWHALGRLVRFNVPEIFGATTMYLKEEAEDIKTVEAKEVKTTMSTAEQDQEIKKLGGELKKRTFAEAMSYLSELKKQSEKKKKLDDIPAPCIKCGACGEEPHDDYLHEQYDLKSKKKKDEKTK